MDFFEKMINDSDDKEIKRKLTLAGYLYREIENAQNAEKLEELISLIIEVFGKEPTQAAPKRKFESKILQDFYNYLLHKCKMEESTSYDYYRRIARILREQGIAVEDLVNGKIDIQLLIDKYLRGGGKEQDQNERQHNGPSSALKKFKQYIEEAVLAQRDDTPYIDDPEGQFEGDGLSGEICKNSDTDLNDGEGAQLADAHIYLQEVEGYQSFENMRKHVCEIEIIDRQCTIKYRENRCECDVVHKVINRKNYANLIRVMRKYKHILNQDPTPACDKFPFGGVWSVSYEFEDKSNYNDVFELFVSDDRALAERADAELGKVLRDIENQ